jgi:hypothetical protein
MVRYFALASAPGSSIRGFPEHRCGVSFEHSFDHSSDLKPPSALGHCRTDLANDDELQGTVQGFAVKFEGPRLTRLRYSRGSSPAVEAVGPLLGDVHCGGPLPAEVPQ